MGNRIVNTGATSVAGRTHEAIASTGFGGVIALTGTPGAGAAFTSASGGLPQANPTVGGGMTKHLAAMKVWTNVATMVPGYAILTDLLYMYPSLVVTGTPTTLNNSVPTPTRFGTGVGVRALCVAATALGAAQPVLSTLYTDETSDPGRVGAFAASANSLPVGAAFTGTNIAGQLGSANMRMDAGDAGIETIDSYTISAGSTTGTVSMLLHRPIAGVPLVAANVVSERNFLFDLPSLPKIEENACLCLLVVIGGALVANSIINYELETVWG